LHALQSSAYALLSKCICSVLTLLYALPLFLLAQTDGSASRDSFRELLRASAANS
jgi:hypothetical protein